MSKLLHVRELALMLVEQPVCASCGAIAVWDGRLPSDLRLDCAVRCPICGWLGLAPRAVPLPIWDDEGSEPV